MQVETKKTKRPAKWSEKWSGPHVITGSGKSSDHYTFRHAEKGREVEAHVNRLNKFCPWEKGITSTSWETDEKRKFQTGAWVEKGSLVLVPLEKPFPFGIAKLIECDSRGNLRMQWYGNNKLHPEGKYEPGWITPSGRKYYAKTQETLDDKPYLTEDDGVLMHQRDVLLHDFELTKGERLPEALLEQIALHPLVWWAPKRFTGTQHDQ
jgi:hypothetical protein